MSETVRKNSWICPFIWICTRSWWGWFWTETHPRSTIQGNQFCRFRVILLTNQPANQPTDKGEKTKHHWLVNISACITLGLLFVTVVFIVCLIDGVRKHYDNKPSSQVIGSDKIDYWNAFVCHPKSGLANLGNHYL